MSQDEEVDGPAIAAAILNNMDKDRKDRIVKAIAQSDPQIASKIEENLFQFTDLETLTPQSVQLLMNEVLHRDIVLSLKTAETSTKEYLFENMSERKKALVLDDFEALPPTRLADVENAQKRILERMEELRAEGKVRTHAPNDVWV